ncbi:MAG: type II toxin-antitoxin system VapB family antitoxin [Chloroflexota bacterium]|nr:type II toxin-antitoxin system VapB family antitoxin [Chloroflexota bacterium]
MSLNIKNPETYRLAKELADQTGESLTGAVTEAIRERLDRLKFEQGRDGMAERIHAIAADMRARLPDDFFDIAHGDLLYDVDGLPK